MANLNPELREPKRDCINYRNTGVSVLGSCRGLKELCCVTDLNGCPFYKSKYEYGDYGSPLKGRKDVL